VRSGRLGTPYRQRIAASRERIVVPPGFDRSKASDRQVRVGATGDPPTQVPRSTCLESRVIAFLDRAEHANRRSRILDFKRGCESQGVEERKRSRGRAFDLRAAGERLSRVIP